MDNEETEDRLAPLHGSPFADVPVEITVTVGRARPLLKELVAMQDDAVFPLDRGIDDPVELFVSGKLIGRGTLEELGEEGSGSVGVRLIEITKLPDSL